MLTNAYHLLPKKSNVSLADSLEFEIKLPGKSGRYCKVFMKNVFLVDYLLARFGPISVKNLLKFSAMESIFVILLLSTTTFVGNLCQLHFSFPIASVIICPVFLMLLLYFSINFEECSLSERLLMDSKDFL